MTFFETLVALLAVAILLLQVTRRMHLPYPGILAAAGVAVAMLPGGPSIPIQLVGYMSAEIVIVPAFAWFL